MKDHQDNWLLSVAVPPLAFGLALFGYALLFGWSILHYRRLERQRHEKPVSQA